jgi:DNA-binding LytR/AlgR family response regulator
MSEICFIECIGDYVTIYTANDKFTIHSTMKAVEQKLNDPMFIRVHRSHIVRLDKIDEIEDDSISLGKKIVPIGKTYKQEVQRKLNFL